MEMTIKSNNNTKIIPYTNGILKHHNHHRVILGNGGSADVAAYKECLRNHAASQGHHVLDGCGEFMPAHNSTMADPTSLKCAACGCHRNFHRRITVEVPGGVIFLRPVFGSQDGASRKRFRTKFSEEQKEKMQDFSEKIGWKMMKINEDLINRFCSEIGVQRGVFKVWMHNNKNNNISNKNIRVNDNTNYVIRGNDGGIRVENNNINNNVNIINEEDEEVVNGNGNSSSSNQVSTNGSTSFS